MDQPTQPSDNIQQQNITLTNIQDELQLNNLTLEDTTTKDTDKGKDKEIQEDGTEEDLEDENNNNNNKGESVAFEISFTKKSDIGASEILENFLFLGAGRDANDLKYIQNTGITHVLCMVSGWKPRVSYSDVSVNFLHLPISDTPAANISILFPRAIEFINGAKASQAKILVHCAAGISRSTTIVLAYLMKSHNMKLKEAFTLVHSKRRIIRPNNGFFDQLMEWEKSIHGSHTMTHKDLPFIVPRLSRQVFTPSKALAIEEGMAWAATVVTEEMLNSVFAEVCGGEYVPEKTADFLDKVLLLAKEHPSVTEMQQKGFKWPKLSINLMRTASLWYKAQKK